MKKILITAALPYANGPLHFGHLAGAYLPADCYARHMRQKGFDVLFICGSDEYGIAITLSAELAHRTPKEHVDIFHKMNREFFQKMDFSFNHYSRTTWPRHKETVLQFFLDLKKNGYIEEKEEKHLYSEEEKRFLADRYVVGICPKCGYEKARGDECPKCGASFEAKDLKNPVSKISGTPLILKPSKHLYVRFDLFKDKLSKWIGQKKWKPNVLEFAKNYIDNLQPRAITRDSTWGVEVPDTKNKVFYVWFDAPIGYISATKEWAEIKGNPDLWKNYWLDPATTYVQFIGKDNIPFHAVFFPAMVMGQDIPYKQVDELPANEFLLLEGKRFSKSENWTIDLDDFFKKYSVDQIRYYLAAVAPETSDSEFIWKEFQQRSNAELLGKFGNFIHRSLTFVSNFLDGEVPPRNDLDEKDSDFLQKIEKKKKEIDEAFSTFQLRRSTQLLMELASFANCYFDEKKPWSLAKDPSKRQELETTLNLCLYCIKALAFCAYPVIPETSEKVYQLLGYSKKLSEEKFDVLEELPINQKLLKPYVLFRKIEDEEIEKEKQKLFSHLKKSSFKEEIVFEDFEKIDLRVGKIISAEKLPKSKKLLILKVDLGEETRQIVSGIAEHFAPETLIGRSYLFVANLKPVKIMGVESQGMLLAGWDKVLELPSFSALPPGTKVS